MKHIAAGAFLQLEIGVGESFPLQGELAVSMVSFGFQKESKSQRDSEYIFIEEPQTSFIAFMTEVLLLADQSDKKKADITTLKEFIREQSKHADCRDAFFHLDNGIPASMWTLTEYRYVFSVGW